MNIIAHKTNFYTNEQFFKEVINEKYIDGIYIDVLYNIDDKIIVYNYNASKDYSVQQFQKTPINQLTEQTTLTLEQALKMIEENNKDTLIYVNLIPVSFSVTDEASLKELNEINQKYLTELKKEIEKYEKLNINLHSINRNLVLLVKKNFENRKTGIILYSGDLTPTDVDYYIFFTYMIDNTIFEELININKGIMIYAIDEDDLAIITEKYNSEKSTALSQQLLPHLDFIATQPFLVNRLLPKRNTN